MQKVVLTYAINGHEKVLESMSAMKACYFSWQQVLFSEALKNKIFANQLHLLETFFNFW